MTNEALIAELRKRPPHGEVQIFLQEDGGCFGYYQIEKVNGFINAPDTVIEAGDIISTGS